jgi:hypothetical protein
VIGTLVVYVVRRFLAGFKYKVYSVRLVVTAGCLGGPVRGEAFKLQVESTVLKSCP